MEYRVELSIKNMEKGEKIHILGIFRDMYWYTLKVYRYTLPEPNVYRYTLFCFSCFDQFSYFGHNLIISYPI